MKALLTFLFYYSLSTFAGVVHLEVRVTDITDNSALEKVKIELGDRVDRAHVYSGNYTDLFIEDLSKENFTDTLFVHSSGYSFDLKPLIEHNYTISEYDGEISISLIVYGTPHIRNYTLELSIAKSRKTVMDSVSLQIYIEEYKDLTSLKLMHLNGHEMIEIKKGETNSNYIEQYVLYSDLGDGYFEMETNGVLSRYPFRKTDCLQPIYLGGTFNVRDQERDALYGLIDLQQSQISSERKMEWKHELEMDELSEIIDSLETEIYILKYGPITGFPAPEPEEEYPVEEVQHYLVVKDQPAEPMMGMDAFLEGLKDVLKEHTIKKSGVATIDISVSKYGKVNFSCSSEDEDITNGINNHMDGITWSAYRSWGKPIHSDIKIYLDFYKE